MKLKPYMLVRVRLGSQYDYQPHREFIGEVMSFETPEHTVMVRQIPGHPGTLLEVPVSAVSMPAVKFRYVQYAIVSGRGAFPEDMLRYDSCVPVNFTISLHHGIPKAVMNEGEEQAEMMVADVTERKEPTWTYARWTSFWWTCKHLKTEKIGEGS